MYARHEETQLQSAIDCSVRFRSTLYYRLHSRLFIQLVPDFCGKSSEYTTIFTLFNGPKKEKEALSHSVEKLPQKVANCESCHLFKNVTFLAIFKHCVLVKASFASFYWPSWNGKKRKARTFLQVIDVKAF